MEIGALLSPPYAQISPYSLGVGKRSRPMRKFFSQFFFQIFNHQYYIKTVLISPLPNQEGSHQKKGRCFPLYINYYFNH